jgi:hypothetical protein
MGRSGYDRVNVGLAEHGNETWGYIKLGECIDQLS